MPYWLTSTLAATPAILWMIFGVGLPWALAVLPRKDWSHYALVGCAALGFGPAWVTTWMFILGTIGGAQKEYTLIASDILVGTMIIAGVGAALAWRKRGDFAPESQPLTLSAVEWLLIALMVIALILRWFSAAYWTFITYDPLWVYGYQGRLYTLLGYIPTDIGYYPQFVQLQYAYGQIMTGGVIDDHAARAVIWYMALGSTLAVYVLGERLFNRRVGIFAAGLWTLYPHVGEWAFTGDLEIPLTFTFTAAAAFFLTAWMSPNRRERWHYGMIAGLFLGIALWTKPTAGALVWGVILVVALDLVRVRFDWRRWLPRFEVAFATGLATIPLGGMWYIRNILLGHSPVDLPHSFWLTQALRSGQEFGWLLLALAALVLFLLFSPLKKRPTSKWLLFGFALIILSLAPTILTPRRMNVLEWAALFAGITTFAWTLWRDYGETLSLPIRRTLARIGWALALALPYFITWFYSYSYHYRLSFAIVPLMLLPTAVILAEWVSRERVIGWSSRSRLLLTGIVLVLGIPGTFNALYHNVGGWDWLWSNEFPTDMDRMAANNSALIQTVQTIQEVIDAEGMAAADTVIVAPGLQRLPFFFPQLEVRIKDTPAQLSELEGIDFYVYTQETRWLYEEHGLPDNNPVTGSMQRRNVMQRIGQYSDGSFFSRIYRVLPPDKRFESTYRKIPRDVIYGDFAQLIRMDVSKTILNQSGEADELRIVWKALKPAEKDYSVYVHLHTGDGVPVVTWDNPPARGEFTYYSTQFWEAGEYVVETRKIPLPDNIPPGEYRLSIGFYDIATQERVPATRDGQPFTGGYLFSRRLTVLAQGE